MCIAAVTAALQSPIVIHQIDVHLVAMSSESRSWSSTPVNGEFHGAALNYSSIHLSNVSFRVSDTVT